MNGFSRDIWETMRIMEKHILTKYYKTDRNTQKKFFYRTTTFPFTNTSIKMKDYHNMFLWRVVYATKRK